MKKPLENKKFYLIGIGGTGMGAFAGLLKQAGYKVSGSDTKIYPPMSDKLKDWQIEVKSPYQISNLKSKPDIVIVGNVASKDNVEAAFVREQGWPFLSFPQALGKFFLKDRQSVVVAGTHGKTTTSALIAHTLAEAKLEPGFLIGGIPQNWGESFHFSPKPNSFFVVEGDEYDTAYFDKGPKFLHYQPRFLLCTSLEYDHADIYQNVEQIITRFTELLNLVPESGHIVLQADSEHLKTALKNSKLQTKVTTYGKKGDFTARDVAQNRQGCSFSVWYQEKNLGEIKITLAGEHNINNALGAYALLLSMGLSHQQIAPGFASFLGVKRRLEEIGESNGVLVIDDFAHHPSAVKTTIEGAKKKYGGTPLWALFEPRSASSCRKVFQADYVKSFLNADQVLLAPPGRLLAKTEMLDTKELADQIAAKNVPARATDSIEELIKIVVDTVPDNAVILCMSNGAFGGIHQRILAEIKAKNIK
ncbi:MAG: UDP-N-acetylmuramate:L-alanyl-gamma-D-glutamyl-meso-diaminopimelate ligase [bacterium]|nr:UDP-N-acetylmuramate:L-alanyl-gamma-D-glutamyl-meso-diaminopimelate ligase [bacterium]